MEDFLTCKYNKLTNAITAEPKFKTIFSSRSRQKILEVHNKNLWFKVVNNSIYIIAMISLSLRFHTNKK